MRAILLGMLLAFGLAGAAFADPLLGTWRTAADDNGHTGLIEVTVCGSSLCGELVEAFDQNGTTMPSPNIGRLIIWDTNTTQGGDYVGRRYSPDGDDEYESRLVLSGDSLSVSGCRRVLGVRGCREGDVWTRENCGPVSLRGATAGNSRSAAGPRAGSFRGGTACR